MEAETEQAHPPQGSSNPNPWLRYFLTHEQKVNVVAHIFQFHLFPMVSFQELKRLRQVCRAWEIYVASSPRFQSTTLKVNREWHVSHTKPKNQEDSLVTLGGRSKMALHGSPFRGPYFVQTYWPAASQNVTHLSLVRMKLECIEMTGLLEACPKLTHLTIDTVKTSSNVEVDPITGIGQNHFCTHEPEHQINLNEPYTSPQGLTPGSGIQSLIFVNHTHLPPCTMNHIGPRVFGSLKIMKCLVSRDQWLFRDPTTRAARVQFYGWTHKLIRENRNTLEEIKVYDGIFQSALLMWENPQAAPSFPSIKKHGVRCWRWRELPRQRDHGIRPQFQNFLTHVALRVTFLHDEGQDWTSLIEFLFQFRNLQSLKIRGMVFQGIPPNGQPIQNQQQSWETHFPHLKKLAIHGSTFLSHPDMTFLGSLPGTIETLKTNVSIPKAQLLGFIHRPNNNLTLRTLSLDRGNPLIDDEMLQVMIGSFPQLESLRIKSVKVTDAGLIGIGLKAQQGRNLKELTRLQSLDLSGCKEIGDLSLKLAIGHLLNLNFLGLRDTRVSDKGLVFVISNVLPLEKLELFRVKKLTPSGVARILKSKGTLRTLWLSKSLLEDNGPVGLRRNEQDPTWKRVVKYKRKLRHIFSIIH